MPDTISSADAIHPSTTGSATTEPGPSTDPTGASNAASGAAAPSAPAQTAETPPPSAARAAVQRCCDTWRLCYRAEINGGISEYSAESAANTAFRRAMPILSSAESIRAFIACVAHGMLLRAIDPTDGTRLLYAAQVALASLPRESRVGRPPKEKTPPPPLQR